MKNYSLKEFTTTTFIEGLKGGAIILITASLIVSVIILLSNQI